MTTPAPILMYHSVDTACAPAYRRWTVTPKTFTAQMDLLRARGCSPLTISDLVQQMRAGTPLAPGTIAITFDDGLADFYRHALPILEERGFASTLYVTTGHVGGTASWLHALGEGDRAMMSWDELATLGDRGVECGAHTHTHPQLDLLPIDRARAEIETSKSLLEDRLGLPVSSFAYPHGYSTPAVRRIVDAAGFTSACRVAHALSATSETPLGLSRIIVTEETSIEQLGQYLDGHDLEVAPAQWRPRMLAWRAYRAATSFASGLTTVNNAVLDTKAGLP